MISKQMNALISELCQANTQLAILHALVQSSGQIMRKREGHRLEDWKKLVYESSIAEVQRFAKGLERDGGAGWPHRELFERTRRGGDQQTQVY